MQHIISPGFAKSGTTFLHYLLTQCDALAQPKNGKELNFFLGETSDAYCNLFETENNKTIATFEFSPVYFSTATKARRSQIIRSFRDLRGDPLILLAIRHPLNRAISHYVHLLQDFARFGRGRYTPGARNMNEVYGDSFEAALATNAAVGIDIGEVVEEIFELYPRDRILMFFLETDGLDITPFVDRLSSLLGSQLKCTVPKHVSKIGTGRPVPTHFYSEFGRDTLEVSGRRFVLPHGSLYISSDFGHEILENIDPLIGRAWVNSNNLWTTQYYFPWLTHIYEHYFKDMVKRLDAVISQSADAKRAPEYASLDLRQRQLARVAFDAEFLAARLRSIS